MKFNKSLFLLPLLVYPLAAVSETVIVVSSNREETNIKKVASSVTVITAKEIEERKIATVSEALKMVPGVDVVQSGGAGGNVAVFIRGANSEHTLVLIDGIEANNPISNNRAFNLADLSVDNIERIEVVRGPQSTLFGSDAMGGVIQIFTKKGKGDPKAFVSFEGGSYETFVEKAGLSGATEKVNYSFGASRLDTGGTSAAKGGEEQDAHRNTAISTKLGFLPSERLEFNYTLKYDDAKSDIDNFGGVYGEDPNRLLDNETLFTRAEARLNLLDKKFASTFGAAFSDHKLRDNNNPDSINPLDILRSQYDGTLTKLDWLNNYKVGEVVSFIAGIETEKEEASSVYRSFSSFGEYNDDFNERSARNNGYFLQARIAEKAPLSLVIGGRIDDHSKFGNKETWRVAPLYNIESTATKFSGTIGTGFKAPSLFQLYSSFGKETLQPEESLGWDLGVEQSFYDDTLAVGTTYFRNNFDDLISFDPSTFIFENIAAATTKGFESFVRYQQSDQLEFSLNHTYTEATDDDSGQALLRRAKNKYLLSIIGRPIKKLYFRGDLRIVGSRWDNDFSGISAMRTRLPTYAIVDLSSGYDLSERLQLFARAENLFDKEYEEVLGFGTRGFGVYAGIKVTM